MYEPLYYFYSYGGHWLFKNASITVNNQPVNTETDLKSIPTVKTGSITEINLKISNPGMKDYSYFFFRCLGGSYFKVNPKFNCSWLDGQYALLGHYNRFDNTFTIKMKKIKINGADESSVMEFPEPPSGYFETERYLNNKPAVLNGRYLPKKRTLIEKSVEFELEEEIFPEEIYQRVISTQIDHSVTIYDCDCEEQEYYKSLDCKTVVFDNQFVIVDSSRNLRDSFLSKRNVYLNLVGLGRYNGNSPTQFAECKGFIKYSNSYNSDKVRMIDFLSSTQDKNKISEVLSEGDYHSLKLITGNPELCRLKPDGLEIKSSATENGKLVLQMYNQTIFELKDSLLLCCDISEDSGDVTLLDIQSIYVNAIMSGDQCSLHVVSGGSTTVFPVKKGRVYIALECSENSISFMFYDQVQLHYSAAYPKIKSAFNHNILVSRSINGNVKFISMAVMENITREILEIVDDSVAQITDFQAPTILLENGYLNFTTVKDAVIYYTYKANGQPVNPSQEAGIKFTSPFLARNGNYRVIAVVEGTKSAIATKDVKSMPVQAPVIQVSGMNLVMSAEIDTDIYYTFSANGQPVDPTTNSTRYTQPVALQNGFYKAIGVINSVKSVIAIKEIKPLPVQKPNLQVNGQTIVMTGESGSRIFYNYNAANEPEEPTSSSLEYLSPIVLKEGYYKIISKLGINYSEITKTNLRIKPVKPQIVISSQTIVMSAEPGTEIYYTANDYGISAAPSDRNWTKYITALSLKSSNYKAIARKNFKNSDVAELSKNTIDSYLRNLTKQEAISAATELANTAKSEAVTAAVYTAASLANAAKTEAISAAETKLSEMVGASPETLNTLNELATALGNDPNFATTTAAEIGKKIDTTTAISNIETAKSEAITAAGTDATTKANAAKTAAEATAANLATTAKNEAITAAGTAADAKVKTVADVVNHATTGLATKASNTEFQTVKSAVNHATTGLATKASNSEFQTVKTAVNHATTGLATKISTADANTAISTAKTEAITAAGTDATSKANAAKEAAEATAASLAGTAKSEAISAAKTELDNLQIGGRNLLTNSNYNTIKEGVPGLIHQEPLGEKLKPKTKYTLTVCGKCFPGFDTEQALQTFVTNESWNWTAIVNVQEQTETTKIISFTTPEIVQDIKIVFYLLGLNTGWALPSGKVFLEYAKLEIGSKATDWTPAPEDTTAEILTAKNAAETKAATLAGTAKSEAIATATTLAETAKSEAMQGATPNLLHNTGEFKDLSKWSITVNQSNGTIQGNSAVIRNDYYTGYTPGVQLHVSEITNGTEYIMYQNVDTIIGNEYNLSMLIAGHRSKKVIAIMDTQGWLESRTYIGTTPGGNLLSNWINVSIPFIARKSSTMIAIMIAGDSFSDCYLWVKNIKLNFGLIQTAWSKSKQDLDEEMQNTKNSILQSAQATAATLAGTAKSEAISAAKTELDNLKIGGRNLLPNSFLNKNYSIYSFYYQKANVTAGNTYTFTVKAHAVNAQNNCPLQIHFVPNGSWDYYQTIRYEVGEQLSVKTKTFTIPAQFSDRQFYVSAYYENNATTGSVFVEYIKIEAGHKATDWTPAPEDTAAEIATATERIDEIEQTTSENSESISTTWNKLTGLEKSSVFAQNKIVFGNQDWTDLIVGGTKSQFTYSDVYQGLIVRGVQTFVINSTMAIDPLSSYKVTVKCSSLDGNATLNCGVDTLNASKLSISADQASPYNWGAAFSSATSLEVQKYEGYFSGYNAPGEANKNKFDPNGRFFRVAFLCNKLKPAEFRSVIHSVEIEKISVSRAIDIVEDDSRRFVSLAEKNQISDTYNRLVALEEQSIMHMSMIECISQKLVDAHIGNGTCIETKG